MRDGNFHLPLSEDIIQKSSRGFISLIRDWFIHRAHAATLMCFQEFKLIYFDDKS